MDFCDFSLEGMVQALIRLALAWVITMPIALNRESSSRRSLGLRTFPLVAMASCSYVLIGQTILEPAAQARIMQGLITGVGFLGGGAIVKKGLDVHGTATAASIWSTAAIGAAVAYSRYEIAIALSLATLGALWGLRPMKETVQELADEVSESNGEDRDRDASRDVS